MKIVDVRRPNMVIEGQIARVEHLPNSSIIILDTGYRIVIEKIELKWIGGSTEGSRGG